MFENEIFSWLYSAFLSIKGGERLDRPLVPFRKRSIHIPRRSTSKPDQTIHRPKPSVCQLRIQRAQERGEGKTQHGFGFLHLFLRDGRVLEMKPARIVFLKPGLPTGSHTF